jgi:hypothetical protein
MKVEQNEAGGVVMIGLDDELIETTTIDLTNPVMLALRAEVEAILARAAALFESARARRCRSSGIRSRRGTGTAAPTTLMVILIGRINSLVSVARHQSGRRPNPPLPRHTRHHPARPMLLLHDPIKQIVKISAASPALAWPVNITSERAYPGQIRGSSVVAHTPA